MEDSLIDVIGRYLVKLGVHLLIAEANIQMIKTELGMSGIPEGFTEAECIEKIKTACSDLPAEWF